MKKMKSKEELFEHYAKIAEKNIKQTRFETFRDCLNRKEFSDYMLNVFIAYYGLRCTCDDIQDWDFNNASGHYQKCDLWKFCHIINRCLDWAEKNDKDSIDIEGIAQWLKEIKGETITDRMEDFLLSYFEEAVETMEERIQEWKEKREYEEENNKELEYISQFLERKLLEEINGNKKNKK